MKPQEALIALNITEGPAKVVYSVRRLEESVGEAKGFAGFEHNEGEVQEIKPDEAVDISESGESGTGRKRRPRKKGKKKEDERSAVPESEASEATSEAPDTPGKKKRGRGKKRGAESPAKAELEPAPEPPKEDAEEPPKEPAPEPPKPEPPAQELAPEPIPEPVLAPAQPPQENPAEQVSKEEIQALRSQMESVQGEMASMKGEMKSFREEVSSDIKELLRRSAGNSPIPSMRSPAGMALDDGSLLNQDDEVPPQALNMSQDDAQVPNEEEVVHEPIEEENIDGENRVAQEGAPNEEENIDGENRVAQEGAPNEEEMIGEIAGQDAAGEGGANEEENGEPAGSSGSRQVISDADYVCHVSDRIEELMGTLQEKAEQVEQYRSSLEE